MPGLDIKVAFTDCRSGRRTLGHSVAGNGTFGLCLRCGEDAAPADRDRSENGSS